MKTAMKSGDRPRLEVIRFMLSQLNSFQKDKMAKEPNATITDEETITVLQKDAKRRKESIELFKQGKRDDLVQKEEADLAIIMSYLPAEMSRAEIAKTIDGLKAQGFTEFSILMREAMKALKGRADGKTVGEIVKEKTS
jgi:uncharacterized protein YqeY